MQEHYHDSRTGQVRGLAPAPEVTTIRRCKVCCFHQVNDPQCRAIHIGDRKQIWQCCRCEQGPISYSQTVRF